MDIHPAAELFPMMDATELRALAKDIRANGLREPIDTLDGAVLDGRNRLAACQIAKMRPAYNKIGSCKSPVAFVLSKNLHRRHLKPVQKASVAVEAAALMKVEAKERQKAAAKKTHAKRKAKTSKKNASARIGRKHIEEQEPTEVETEAMEEAETGEALVHAAKMSGAGKNSTKALAKIKRDAPEVFEAVQRGILASVEDAKRVAAIGDPDERAEALMHIGEGMSVEDAVTAKTKEDRSISAAVNGAARALKAIVASTDRVSLSFAEFREYLEQIPAAQLSGIELQTSLAKVEWGEKTLRELAALLRSRTKGK